MYFVLKSIKCFYKTLRLNFFIWPWYLHVVLDILPYSQHNILCIHHKWQDCSLSSFRQQKLRVPNHNNALSIYHRHFSLKKSWKKPHSSPVRGGGWGCEVSCGGHHRPRGKTTTGSALDGAVFDIAQILAYLVHNMSRSQLYLGFGHFGWLPSIFDQ